MNILDARCPVVMLSSLFVLPSFFLLFMDVHKMNLAKNLPQCSFLCVCCMTVFFCILISLLKMIFLAIWLFAMD